MNAVEIHTNLKKILLGASELCNVVMLRVTIYDSVKKKSPDLGGKKGKNKTKRIESAL